MSETSSKIKLILEGVEKGVLQAVAKTKAALAGLKDENDKISKSFDTLDRGASKAGTALLGIAKGIAVLGAAGGAVQVIGGVLGALKDLVPIALLLPGALLAGGAAMLTFKIATEGFGKAISAGLSGDMAKFTKDIKNMAPAMQDAAKAVVALKPQIDDLKKTVQGNFWTGFSAEITKLGQGLLPVLKRGLGDVATNLGTMAREALKAANTPFFTGAVGNILANTSLLLGNMSPALANVLTGFVKLGEVGSRFLPQVGTAITEVTAKFKDWVTANSQAGGEIERLVNTAIQAFQDLGGIVQNVGSILNSVFRGLGGSLESPLASLRELTAQLAEFLKTAEAQEGLKALGEILSEAGSAMKDILLAAIKELLPTIKELAPGIKALIAGFKDFALDLIHTVGPALRDVGRFMAEHKEAVRQLVPVIGLAVLAFKGLKVLLEVKQWASEAKTALKLLGDLLPGIGTNGGKAAGGLKGMVGPLKGIAAVVGLAVIADQLDKINVAAAGGDPAKLQGMEADLHGIVEEGKKLLQGDFSGVLEDITRDVQEFGDTWARQEAPIQQFAIAVDRFLNPVATQIRTMLLPAVAGVEAGFRVLPTTIGQHLTTLAGVVTGFGTRVTATFNEEIRAGFETTRTIVAGVPAALVNALSPLGGLLANQGATSSASFATNIGAGFERARQITAALPGQIVAALTPLAGALGTQGATAGNNFGTQLGSAFARARAATAAVPGQIVAALSPLAGQLGNTGATAGTTFNNRLTGALNQAAGQARTATAGIVGAISGALSGLGTVGSNAGAALGRGLVSGLNSMFSQVQTAARAIANVASAAVQAAGVIRSPSKLWAKFGRQFAEGLIQGLDAGHAGVSLASARLADTASGSLTGGFSISAPNPNAGALQQLLSLQSQQGVPQIRVYIGDRDITDIVRTEITSSNRATRRTVTAGAGTTF